MRTRYERDIYQLLSFYRFFSFGLAVVLIQVLPLEAAKAPPPQTYLILTLVGIYTLLKVFSPLRWRQRDPMTYVVLGGDLFLCILLLLLTGGLDSGFLLYSLTPIIAAALLFEERIALFMAALTSLSLVVCHLILNRWSDNFVWLMQGNYLPLLIIYIIFCFLIATLSYRTNLNIRQRIEKGAILDERRRIGQEMHDGVAQALSYLNLKTKLVSDSVSAQNLEEALIGLGDIRRTVQDTYEDIRESIDQLSIEVSSFPLIPTLNRYIREFGEKSGIKVEFEVPGGLPNLSPVAELQLLRIAQEALTNVRRHAQATRVWGNLEDDTREVGMTVRDNGQGFFLADPQGSYADYHGLEIMRERVESLEGNLQILTAPGEGTEIRVSLPSEKVRL